MQASDKSKSQHPCLVVDFLLHGSHVTAENTLCAADSGASSLSFLIQSVGGGDHASHSPKSHATVLSAVGAGSGA